MTSIYHRNSLVLFLAIIGLLFSGCSGILVTYMGRYYQTELDTSQPFDSIRTIGIYVFSDRKSFNLERQNGLAPADWPRRVKSNSWITPDTSNTGPSLALAISIYQELSSRGYRAYVVEDLGHSHDVSVSDCIKNAREHDLDAAIVVVYSGLFGWGEPKSCEECWQFHSLWRTQARLWSTAHRGYLYLPNAAIFNTSNDSKIWSTQYYGIVQNAHLPNMSNEEFTTVADLAVIPSGDIDYMSAAPKTARLMFDPMFWPGSFKEFPSRPAPKRKL